MCLFQKINKLKFVTLGFVLFYASCFSISAQNKDYQKSKNVALENRKKYAEAYQRANNDKLKEAVLAEASEFITTYLVEKIFPQWYGTAWDFNGVSQIPKKGVIACGYFVSTTLRDVGFGVNRIKMAQQNPTNEAETLALGEEIKTVRAENGTDLKNYVRKNLTTGLYFIGLSGSHVGFLYVTTSDVFFIHSNYFGAVGVMKENVVSSPAINSYEFFYITAISNNKSLLKKWLLSEEIKTVVE